MKDLIDFLETNVDGKTLHTKEFVYQLENGALEGVYSDQISFSNLKYSLSGLQWDMFIVSNEKIWVTNNGQRESLRKDLSSVSLFRFELAERKSTGGITGCFRCVSASGKDCAAEAIISSIYDVKLDGGVLTLKEEQASYRDQPVQDGSSKPVAFRSDQRFFVVDGKLHYEYDGESFDVDVMTMQRKVSSDDFPSFVSIEI